MNTGTTWILYIALEPWVRRYTPEHPDLVDARPRGADSSIRASGATSLIGVGVGMTVALAQRLLQLPAGPVSAARPASRGRPTCSCSSGAASTLGFILR